MGATPIGATRSAAIAAFRQKASNSSTWERPAASTALGTAPASWSAASARRSCVSSRCCACSLRISATSVKLVHNGIEFGMMQAIGEGFDLLKHYHESLDIGAVLDWWRHGSVIRSWLIDLLAEAYKTDPRLERPSSYVEDTGEVNWLVSDASCMEVPIPVIAQSVMQLFVSRDAQKNWARVIVLMRHGFGGHPLGPDENIARERREGRVGDVFCEGLAASEPRI